MRWIVGILRLACVFRTRRGTWWPDYIINEADGRSAMNQPTQTGCPRFQEVPGLSLPWLARI